jgi:hypothetical protein
VSDAGRAALAALIDHAPLFPPASLPVPAAIEEDRRARADEHDWLLARLVWPASRLDELEGEDRALSILLDGPYEGDLRAEAVETRWEAGLDGLHGEAYVELPLDDGLAEKAAALAERGLRAKVRCGGADVPSAEALGRFLAVCRDAGVPFKATAGLHHPLAAEGRHGFLNVLAACAFADPAALTAAGIDFATDDEDRARRQNHLKIRPIAGQTRGGGSTWQSFARGSRVVETDFLNGEIVLLGRLHGVPTPVNELLQRLAHELASAGAAPESMSAEEVMARLERA